MKILFVLPYHIDGLEPLGVLSLSQIMKVAGHEVRATPPNKRSIARVLREFQPDILAYSVITGWHRQYVTLNQWVKANLAPECMSLFGGPHSTYFPTYINEGSVDAICIGEGEHAFVEFVTKLEKQDDYSTTRNWWVKHNGAICKNSLRPEIKDLDELPFADRALLEPYPSYTNRNLRAFIASRGCPYNCSYCFNHAYRQLYKENDLTARVRRRSVDHLIAEIRQVREQYGMQSITFFDDIFVTAQDWLDEFADKYSHQVGLPFECNLRVEQVTPQVVAALKGAGCAIIAIGIETADEAMRASILRRRHTSEQLQRACALIREQGILLKSYNILGLPPGNLHVDWDTLKLNTALQVDIPTASIFQPYPGTDLGEQAKREGYWDGSIDSITLGFYSTSPLKIQERSQVEVLQKLFFTGAKFPVVLPLVRVLVKLAGFSLVRRITFWTHRGANWLAGQFGRNVRIAEDLRRAAFRLLGSRSGRPGYSNEFPDETS